MTRKKLFVLNAVTATINTEQLTVLSHKPKLLKQEVISTPFWSVKPLPLKISTLLPE